MTVEITQADRDAAEGWRTTFEGPADWLTDPVVTLAIDFSEHRIAATAELRAEIERLKLALTEADRKNDAQSREWNRAEAEIEKLREALMAIRTIAHYIFETGDNHESRKALEVGSIIDRTLGEQP